MIFRQASRRAPGRHPLAVYLLWDVGFCFLMVFFRVLYRFRRYEMERIPPTGPLLFIANHQSHFDPPMVGVVGVDRPHRSIARSTLFKFKPLAWLMSAFGAIPLRQGESDSAAFKIAINELQSGRSVLIFPEGSRTRDGTIQPFKRGLGLIVKRSGATIQPVAIEGAYDVWKIGAKLPRLRGRIALKAGDPMSAEEFMRDGVDAGMETLRRRLEMLRLELRKGLREQTNGAYPAPGHADKPYWELEQATAASPAPASPAPPAPAEQ